MTLTFERVSRVQSILHEGTSTTSKNSQMDCLDMLAAYAVAGVVKTIDTLYSIPLIGPAVFGLFSPITNLLDELAGDPSAIYAVCNQLNNQADSLQELGPHIRKYGANTERFWNGDEGSEKFRKIIRKYSELFIDTSDLLQCQSSLCFQTAYRVVQTKVAIVNCVIDLLMNIAKTLSGLLLTPWNVAYLFANIVDLVLTTLYQIRDLANELIAEGNKLLGQQSGVGRVMDRAASVLSGNPHSDKDFDEHDPTSFTARMKTQQPHENDALISDILSHGKTKTLPAGWEQLSNEELKRLGVDMSENDGDGFGGQVYRGPNGELVVNFEGTDFSYLPDVVEDGVGGVTMSQQSQRAMDVAESLRRAGHGDNVVYTGNSLGGRLAAVAAMSQGGTAVTFNAAGVSPGTMEYLAAQRGMTAEQLYSEASSGSVREYVLDGEILTTLQENFPVAKDIMPDAPGQRYVIPPTERTSHMSPAEKHVANPQIGDEMRARWPHMKRQW